MIMASSHALRDFLDLRFIAVESEGIRMSLDVREHHLNQAGTLHGGVLMSMIDIACAMAVRAYVERALPGPQEPVADPEQPIITIMLNTAFLGSVSGGAVTIFAHRRGGGKRILFAAATVMDSEGKLIATGDGSYALRRR